MSGGLPIGRPAARYASAIAVQTQWQSTTVAMMPPFRTCVGPAMWCGDGWNVQTVSSPSQRLLIPSPCALSGPQPKQWLWGMRSWIASGIRAFPSAGSEAARPLRPQRDGAGEGPIDRRDDPVAVARQAPLEREVVRRVVGPEDRAGRARLSHDRPQ